VFRYQLNQERESSWISWEVTRIREGSIWIIRVGGLKNGCDWNNSLIRLTVLVQIDTLVLEVIEELLVRCGDSDNLALLAGALNSSGGSERISVTIRGVIGVGHRSDNIEALFLEVELGGISWGLSGRISLSTDGLQSSLGNQGSGSNEVVVRGGVGKSIRQSRRVERNLSLSAASGGFGSCLGCSLFDEFSVFNLGSSYFGGIFGSHRQVVGQNAETIDGIGDVVDTNFSFGSHVSVRTDLVAENVTVVRSCLSGVSIAIRGLS